jgi:hypothetical protein
LLKQKHSGIYNLEGERKGLRILWGLFPLGFAYSDMMIMLVVECGQTEARETMKLLKELPTDVWLELMQSVVDQQ